MGITHSISRGWSGQNGTPIKPPDQTFTGTEELNFGFPLAGNTTNQQQPLAFTKSLLQSIFIYSDEEDITIKTNSSSAPQDTLTIKAGEPFAWDINCGLPNPFAGNVTTAFFTNAESAATNVSVRCLTNG